MAVKKSELYSILWSSCDKLRGGMDASQYKDYVLVILFIKYVSDKYSGMPFAPIKIPDGASFTDMVALKGSSDIGDQINRKITGPLQTSNNLSDMPDFNDATKLGTGKDMVDTLTNLIAIFENPNLNFSSNRAEDDDIQSEPRNLSASTVTQLHNVFKQALSHAVMDGILQRNPAEYIKPPKKLRAKFEAWELETILEFLELSADTRYGDLYKFAVLTGMRRSEICGLKWAAVNLSEGYLNVVRTLQYINGLGMVEGKPKTHRSERTISLSKEVLDLLRSIKGKQVLQQYYAGNLWQGLDYVFANEDGSPLHPDLVTQEFKRIVRRHNLPDMKLHGLRHAFASLALSAEVPAKVVSEALGHSTINITLDIYSHVLKPQKSAAVEQVANLLSGAI